MSEVPEYRLTRDSFFEPNFLPKGSTIRWEGGVGDHLEPLNQAAYERLQEWYALEVPELDRHGKDTGKTTKIRERLRPAPYAPGEAHSAQVMALPEAPTETPRSLAEVMNANPRSTSQRPPAEVLDQRAVWQPDAEPALAEPVPTVPQPAVLSVGKSDLPTPRRT